MYSSTYSVSLSMVSKSCLSLIFSVLLSSPTAQRLDSIAYMIYGPIADYSKRQLTKQGFAIRADSRTRPLTTRQLKF